MKDKNTIREIRKIYRNNKANFKYSRLFEEKELSEAEKRFYYMLDKED